LVTQYALMCEHQHFGRLFLFCLSCQCRWYSSPKHSWKSTRLQDVI